MAEQQSSNPALKNKAFQISATGNEAAMTTAGVSFKAFVLLIVCLAGGAYGWMLAEQNAASLWIWLVAGSFVGLGIALLTGFKPKVAWFTGPLYALTQGVLLGAISYWANLEFEGIVLQAVLVTGAIFLATLLLYGTGLIKVSKKFVLGVILATAGLALYYVAYLIFALFGVELPLVNSNSPWGIAFSVVVIILAALNLILDFDFIKRAAANNAPKYLEWYASFSLIVTLLWLYVEVLRLLGKARR